ncbi:MAG: hypothetical protein K2O36_03135, partial [Ruminococcus sp.]|nr:hypothetical protein [Ruminococcus sp.]
MLNDKSIAELENIECMDCGIDSYVVRTSLNALKKPLNQLDIQEIRLLITQKLGVKYVLPVAVNALECDIFQEATYYDGDLLNAVLNLPMSFWNDNKNEYEKMRILIKKNYLKIQNSEFVDKEF